MSDRKCNCGEDINYAINNGLCDACIEARLATLEAEVKKHRAETVANLLCYLVDHHENEPLSEVYLQVIGTRFLSNKKYNLPAPSSGKAAEGEECSECGKKLPHLEPSEKACEEGYLCRECFGLGKAAEGEVE